MDIEKAIERIKRDISKDYIVNEDNNKLSEFISFEAINILLNEYEDLKFRMDGLEKWVKEVTGVNLAKKRGKKYIQEMNIDV